MQQVLLPNTIIGEYRIVEFLGRGGMGEVYRAEHSKIGRVAAVKVLTLASTEDGMLDRFFNEARIQARLHHPNVATLYDFIERDGMPIIIMEYVDGQNLCDRIRPSGPLPLGETAYIFQAVVEAVAYVHSHGIVHRDIKSNNIKINTAGQVKLLDFGIAKAEASPGLTATGSVIGTLEYISPEQLMGGVADARSDIWALGVLLYEMVTGRVPFEALTLGELCKKIERVEYTPPAVLNATVPREVTHIISRCLRKNPMDRYRLALDLLEDAKRLRPLGPSPGPLPLPLPSPLKGLNWKVAAGAAAGLAVLFVFAIVLYVFANLPPAAPAEPSGVKTFTPQASPDAEAAGAEGQERPDAMQAKTVTIEAVGGKAEVYRDGQKIGETPYKLETRIGETISLTLKRDDAEDYHDEFEVTAQTNNKSYPMKLKDPVSSDSEDQ